MYPKYPEPLSRMNKNKLFWGIKFYFALIHLSNNFDWLSSWYLRGWNTTHLFSTISRGYRILPICFRRFLGVIYNPLYNPIYNNGLYRRIWWTKSRCYVAFLTTSKAVKRYGAHMEMLVNNGLNVKGGGSWKNVIPQRWRREKWSKNPVCYCGLLK